MTVAQTTFVAECTQVPLRSLGGTGRMTRTIIIGLLTNKAWHSLRDYSASLCCYWLQNPALPRHDFRMILCFQLEQII